MVRKQVHPCFKKLSQLSQESTDDLAILVPATEGQF